MTPSGARCADMDGFINLLKPPGMTSSDAVVFVRRLLARGVKVGHGGTLDPDAAGVLPVMVGRGARLFDYFIDKEKEYIALVTLGVTTDTQDATGRVLEVRPVTVGEAEVRAALKHLTGDILQVPPAYSAIKRGGKPMYELARKGLAPELEPRAARVESLDIIGQEQYNQYKINVVCRKGVYVRTLMHDLGEMLGSGGHMSFLLRTRSGVFDIARAVTLETLAETGVAPHLLELDAPLEHLPAVVLDARYRHAVTNGNPVPENTGLNRGEIVRVYLEDAFAGIGEAAGNGTIRFRAMMLAK